jgi:N-acetylglutamate synthase-like GNAT family acetyltransferase
MIDIRHASKDEVGLLSELAVRSKGHWGYDAAFLEACRAELTITPARIDMETVWVAVRAGEVVGFSALLVEGEEAELTDLFVDPDHIGSGVGRVLWDRTVATCREMGTRRIRIEADPHAEHWYLSRGAVRVGEAPSGSIPGRLLPLLEYVIA